MTQQGMPMRSHWPLHLGMAVAGAAGVIASASTLASLATASGWVGWTPWLLPACIDITPAVGAWVWLRGGAPGPARRFGRAMTVVGAVATLAGNAGGHLVTSGHLSVGPVLIVIVGAVPAAALLALAHLAALLLEGSNQPIAHPADTTPAPERPAPKVLVVEDTAPLEPRPVPRPARTGRPALTIAPTPASTDLPREHAARAAAAKLRAVPGAPWLVSGAALAGQMRADGHGCPSGDVARLRDLVNADPEPAGRDGDVDGEEPDRAEVSR